MVNENDSTPDDRFTTIVEDIARISRSVSLGQKKEKYANWGVVSFLVAAISGGGFYVTSIPPRVANKSDIVAAAKQNPEAFRPDPWSGANDLAAMDDLRDEQHAHRLKLHARIDKAQRIAERNQDVLQEMRKEHESIWTSVHKIEEELKEGPSRSEKDIQLLQWRLKSLEIQNER